MRDNKVFNLEYANNRLLLIGILGALTIVASAILTSNYLSNEENKMFIESGYTKEMLPGSPYVQWVLKDK
jgi:hypothetical protein